MVNLMVQTAATINKHIVQMNSSLQQLAANVTQLHQQQQAIINQMAMMTMNHGVAAAAIQHTIAHAPTQIYQPMVLPQYQQGVHQQKCSSLEDESQRTDVEEKAVEVDAHDPDAVGVDHRSPCHMSVTIS